MSLPRPFKVQNWKGRDRPKFWATPFKFSKSIQLLKIFEWYYYDFLRSLIVSDLGKSVWSVPSISIGVLVQLYLWYSIFVAKTAMSDKIISFLQLVFFKTYAKQLLREIYVMNFHLKVTFTDWFISHQSSSLSCSRAVLTLWEIYSIS